MRNYAEYQTQIRRNLQNISFDKKLWFGIQICERLYPEYLKFQESYDFGDSEILKKGIDACIRFKESSLPEKELEDLIERILSVTPDTNDFGELSGSFALNAACAILETLKFLLDSDDEHIFNVASFMYDTIDFKINDKYPNLRDIEIEKHPLLVEEVHWQLDQTKN